MHTERLILREWRKADFSPFFELNSDPEVMRYFPKPLNREESDELAMKIQHRLIAHDWGLWAAEERESGRFVGFAGLNSPEIQLPFTPCIEVGWRLARAYWGKGYATEAGHKALEYAFSTLHAPEVLSFTSRENHRSIAVMKRLGMQNAHENFEHPSVPPGNKLREHVLFRITEEQWLRHYTIPGT